MIPDGGKKKSRSLNRKLNFWMRKAIVERVKRTFF